MHTVERYGLPNVLNLNVTAYTLPGLQSPARPGVYKKNPQLGGF